MTGVVYLSFLNTISAPCSIVLVIASSFSLAVEWRLIEMFSFFLSFLFFSAVVALGSLRMLSMDSLGVSASSGRGGVSMVMLVVVSAEISIASRTGGWEVIVGVAWYLGYLLTSVLVLVSVGILKTLDSCT